MGDKSLVLLKEAGFDVKGIIQFPKNSGSFSLRQNIMTAIDKLPVKRTSEEDEYTEPVRKVKVEKRFNTSLFNTRSLMLKELKGVYFGKNNRNNIN